MRQLLTAIAALLLVITPVAGQQVPKCSVTSKYVCSEKGCEKLDPDGEYILIDFRRAIYTRCLKDARNCESYDFDQPSISGIFLVVPFGAGSFLKVTTELAKIADVEPYSFLEVRAGFLASFNSFGHCDPLLVK